MADLQDWQQMIDLCKALTLQEIFISNKPWIEPLKTLILVGLANSLSSVWWGRRRTE
jgi:hypothetical protein